MVNASPHTLSPETSVLVTGGTGFTGQVIVRKLRESGCRVRCLVRESSDTSGLDGLGVEWIRGDIADPAVVNGAVEGVDVILHSATLYRDASAGEDEHRRVHVESTKLLARAASRQKNFQRFVLVSTVGVHGHVEYPPGDEEAPFAPGDPYQMTKLEAETWLREQAAELGLSFCVMRPAAIFGSGDMRLLKLFRLARKRIFFKVGHGKSLYHLIHVEDLADLILKAAWAPRADGQCFICGNPEAIPLTRMIHVICEDLPKPPKIISLPESPMFFLADMVEAVCKPFGIPPPLYRRRVAFFTKDRSFDTRKVQERLSWQPRYSTEEGLRVTREGYKEKGLL